MKPLVIAEQLRRQVPGGIGTYVRGLTNGLAQAGAVFGTWASRSPQSPDPLLELGGAHISARIPSPVLTRLWDRGLMTPPSGFDVVHATSTAVPPSTGAPMTAMVHDLAWRAFPEAFPPRGRRWHEASLKRVVERTARILVPSHQSANDLMAGGVKGSDIEIVPHGCDHLPPSNFQAAREKLQQAGLKDGALYFLALGTLEPRKNLPRLLAAYSSVRSQFHDDIHLVVAGPVGWGGPLEPTDGVVLIDNAEADEISALLEMAFALVYVPLLEGYGLPVLEAMSRSTPVISSSVPAAGEATLLVDPTNTGAIADALQRITDYDDLRKDLVKAGDSHAARFTWKQSARSHLAVWEALT